MNLPLSLLLTPYNSQIIPSDQPSTYPQLQTAFKYRRKAYPLTIITWVTILIVLKEGISHVYSSIISHSLRVGVSELYSWYVRYFLTS